MFRSIRLVDGNLELVPDSPEIAARLGVSTTGKLVLKNPPLANAAQMVTRLKAVLPADLLWEPYLHEKYGWGFRKRDTAAPDDLPGSVK